MTLRVHFVEVVAIRKAGIKGWEPFKFKKAGMDYIVTGGISRLLTKGPRKDKKVWDGPTNTVVVTQAEILAEKADYVRRTGNCPECCGSGRQMVRWSMADGARHGKCAPCGGTGKQTKPGTT